MQARPHFVAQAGATEERVGPPYVANGFTATLDYLVIATCKRHLAFRFITSIGISNQRKEPLCSAGITYS